MPAPDVPEPPNLPDTPPPEGFVALFSPRAWAWISVELVAHREALRWQLAAVQALITELPALADAFGPFVTAMENLAMAESQTSAAVTRLETLMTEHAAEVSKQIEQLRAVVADLADQPAVAARIDAIADAIEQQNAALKLDNPPETPPAAR